MSRLVILATVTVSACAPVESRVDPDPMDDASAIFSEEALHDVELLLPASDWDELRGRYLEDVWFRATLVFDGERVEEVGIRSRGNGSRSDVKPGLKVDFDRYARGRRFHGLKSLVLDNLTQDAAMMKERVAMGVFRRAGLAAPRVAHGRLRVNGAPVGLYGVVEPVDKRFVRARFGEEEDGNLFDYEWVEAYGFEWRGPEPDRYVPSPFQPQTHETSLDPSGLLTLIETINLSTDGEFADAVGRHLDWAELLDYLAVEAALDEEDGLTGDWSLNNFYLYQPLPVGSGPIRFVPWDKDWTLHGTERHVFANHEGNVLTRRLLADATLRARYAARIRALTGAGGAADAGRLVAEIDRIAEQLAPGVEEDPTTSVETWQVSVETIRQVAGERGAVIRAHLDEMGL